MRRWLLFVLLAVLAVGSVPTHAIPAEFTAWLYTPDTGRMTLVDLSGEVDSFELPLEGAYDTRPYSTVAVAPNGTTMAYVITRFGTFDQQLMVYDYTMHSIIAQYPVASAAYNSIDFGGRFMFSPDSQLIAFGYSFDPSGWEMVVIDLSDFSIAGSIAHTDAAFSGVDAHFGITPMPTYFGSSNSLSFALIRGGTEAIEPVGSWEWDLTSGDVTPIAGAGASPDVFPPTGEAVTALNDDRLASTPDAFMFGQLNTIQVYDPSAHARWPVFHRADWTMYNAHFVLNGRQVAFVAYDGTTERLYIINRDGSLAGSLPPGTSVFDIAGVPDGFVYTKQDGAALGLYSINLRAGDTEGSLVWTGPDGMYPRISWVGQIGNPNFFFIDPPYPSWAELAAPISDGSATASTGGGGSEDSGELAVGSRATVVSAVGDSLRLRSGAGTNFVVLRQLPPGTVVDVIGGPTSAGGFTWWNIRVDDGTTGWAVDFADNEQTLIPFDGDGGGEPVVEATATPGADPSVPSQLAVGNNALVSANTLRLRNAPGLGGAVVREMPRNTYLRIIGGPTQADNFLWWNVRLLDGTTGWAAEIVGAERVLTFTNLLAPTNTPTPFVSPVAPGITPTATFPILVISPVISPIIISTLPVIVITPDTPDQLSPADGAVFNIFPRTTTLIWSSVGIAASYDVQRQWCDANGNNCNDYSQVSTAATSYTFDFIGAQVGRWRVRAVTSGGITSNWSPWRTFRHQR